MQSAPTLYYIILVLAVLMSGCLFLHNVRKNGLSVPPAAGMFALGLVLAWFFAKGVYVCPNYSALKAHGIGKWFLLIPEQFSFVGGAIGFCLAPVLFRAKKRREIPAYLDQLALPGCLLAALVPGGLLLMEIGHTQGKAVQELFPGAKIIKDICGLDRVVWVERI